jgi:hypothetical protein
MSVGVAKYKHSVPDMRGTNGGSRYAMPFHAIPERGQLCDHGSHPSMQQRCHVLHDNPAWLEQSHHANGLKEQPASGTGKAGSLARVADVLAGESERDAINAPRIGEAGAADCGVNVRERANVPPTAGMGPMFRQNLEGIFAYLDLPHGFKSAGPFQAQFNAAYPREE